MTDSKDGKILHAETMDEYKRIIDGKEPVIVWFGAPSCKPCVKIAPVVEELAKKYPHVRVLKLDVEGDEFDSLLGDNWSIPFFELWKNGSKKAKSGIIANLESLFQHYK